jgi:hypothetical protein
VTKLQKLETEEKRRVRGATPEEELKAKQLSDKAHLVECYKAIVSLQARIQNQFHHEDTKKTKIEVLNRS